MNAIVEKLDKLGLPVNVTNFTRLAYLGSRSFRSLPFEEQEEIRDIVRRARRLQR
jgi:hypothetical protein